MSRRRDFITKDENTAGTLDFGGPERHQRLARDHEAACRAIREATTEAEANAALLVALRLERMMTE